MTNAVVEHGKIMNSRLLASEVTRPRIDVTWTIHKVAAKKAAKFDSYSDYTYSYEQELGYVRVYLQASFDGPGIGLFMFCDWDNEQVATRCLKGSECTLVSPIPTIRNRRLGFRDTELCDKEYGWGWTSFVDDLSPYISNDSITINASYAFETAPRKLETLLTSNI